MMKGLLSIFSLFFALCVSAQQPTLLSIEGLGGNGNEYVGEFIAKGNNGGGIVRYTTTSDQSSGNINASCNQLTTQQSTVFRCYDGLGQVIWERCYLYSVDSSYIFMYPLSGGDFILSGTTNNNDRQYLIRKEDALGNILWGSKVYGGTADDQIRDVISTPDGGCLMFGVSNSNDGDVGFHYGGVFSMDLWVLKVDSNGDKLWSTVIGGTDDETAFKVLPAPGNGCYVIGSTRSVDNNCASNHGSRDVIVARLSDSGQIVWVKCYGGSDEEGYLYGWAEEDGYGGLLIATNARSNDGDVNNLVLGSDYWLLNIDSNGVVAWNNCYDGNSVDEQPYSLCIATDGSIWITGRCAGQSLIVHTDAGGNLISIKKLANSGWNLGTMILPLQNGMVMSGGVYQGPGSDEFPSSWFGAVDDIYFAKFAPWTTNIIGVNRELFAVYPSPATTSLTIQSDQNDAHFIITDLTGREVYNNVVINENFEVNVEGWARGVYYLHATIRGGLKFCSKIVLQ